MNYLRVLGFTLIVTVNLSSTAYAQNQADIDYTKSIFLLISQQGTCASGFLVGEGKLISNYHVANSVCPYGNCKGLRLIRSTRLEGPPAEELRFEKATLSRVFPALDLALIEISPPPRIGQPLPIVPSEALQPATPIRVVGFPACQALRLTEGQALTVNPLHITTSVPGAYGSSGSPVLSSDGRLVAVVIQATSLWDALNNILFKREFNLRAVRAENLSDFLSKSDGDSFRLELSMLNAYYKETFKDKADFERMMASYQFLAAAQGLRFRVLRSPALAAFSPQFLWFDDYLDALPQIPKSPEKDQSVFLEIEKLLTAVNIELNGPQRSLFNLVKPEELRTALHAAGRPDMHVNEILSMVDTALQRDFFGVQMQLILYCSIAALIVTAVAALWAASVSYTFFRSQGGFFLKACKALCVAILLWPFSFIIFLFRRGPLEDYAEEEWEDEKKETKRDDDYYWSE